MGGFDLLRPVLRDFLSPDVFDYFHSLIGTEEIRFPPPQIEKFIAPSICSRTQGRLEFKHKFSRDRTDSATCERNRSYRKRENLIYDSIVGQISHSPPSRFLQHGRRRREVRDFKQPVTNPLYINYNPRGYIKNDEEITREYIVTTVEKYNKWLSSLEGQFAPLDPKILIKIIREDLEVPDKSYINHEKDIHFCHILAKDD